MTQTNQTPKVTNIGVSGFLAHLPNILSALRVLGAPIIAVLVVLGLQAGIATPMLQWAFGIFVFCAISDGLDGALARRWHVTSLLGARLDLLGDKILVALVLIGLWLGWACFYDSNFDILAAVINQKAVTIGSIFLLLATAGRDYLVTIWRVKAAKIGVSIRPTFLAKSKTAIIMSGLALVLAGQAFKWLPVVDVGNLVVWGGAILSVYTGYAYWRAVSAP